VLLVPFRVSVPASQQLSHAAYLLLFEPYLTHLIRWKWWYMMVATARLRSILVGMSEMLIDCVFTGWCFQDIHFPCFIQQCRCVTEQWQSSVLVWQPQRRVVELFSCHAVPHAVCKKMPQGDAQCWEILVFFRPIDRMTGWMSLKSLKALPDVCVSIQLKDDCERALFNDILTLAIKTVPWFFMDQTMAMHWIWSIL
jgi:hypothetical protein